MTCEEYCMDLPHAACVGEWNITGEYPDCDCAWICDTTNVTDGGCVPEWSCTEWSECSFNGLQTRSCTDLNSCGTNAGKPEESRTCEAINYCDKVSDSSIKAECNMLFLEDPSFCNEEAYEGCLYDLAKITLNISLCDEINSSFTRNSCKAIVENDDHYCDILVPSLRDLCYTTLDNYLSQRGIAESDDYYCGLIDDDYLSSNCYTIVGRKDFLDYSNDYSVCEEFDFDYNETDYQSIFSCYVYHLGLGNDEVCNTTNKVENLTEVFFDECEALVDNDLTYCYDLNGTERDRCYAHFAYLRNNTLICRDASNNDQCLFIAGKYFGEIEFCKHISQASLKNSCIYSVATRCLVDDWMSCDWSDCDLITNNNGLKDACIFNVLKYFKDHDFVYKNSV
jgi:hypothetical protein